MRHMFKVEERVIVKKGAEDNSGSTLDCDSPGTILEIDEGDDDWPYLVHVKGDKKGQEAYYGEASLMSMKPPAATRASGLKAKAKAAVGAAAWRTASSQAVKATNKAIATAAKKMNVPPEVLIFLNSQFGEAVVAFLLGTALTFLGTEGVLGEQLSRLSDELLILGASSATGLLADGGSGIVGSLLKGVKLPPLLTDGG